MIWKWINRFMAHQLNWAADICDRRAALMLKHGKYHEAYLRRFESDAMRVKAAALKRAA